MAGATELYGALFFDRLAPLHLVGVVERDLAIRGGTAGALPLGIGIGWAGAMPLSQRRAALVGATATGGGSGLLLAWSSAADVALPDAVVAVLFATSAASLRLRPLA